MNCLHSFTRNIFVLLIFYLCYIQSFHSNYHKMFKLYSSYLNANIYRHNHNYNHVISPLYAISSQSQQASNITTKREIEYIESVMGKPFTLPPGKFKPKQSLGQNFLSDQNYVRKIVDSLHDTR